MSGARQPEQRLVEARLMEPEPDYDREHYEELVLRGLESLLLPVGWDEERLAERFSRAREPTLFAFHG